MTRVIKSKLGSVSMYDKVFEPSSKIVLEKKYGSDTSGLTAKANVPSKELKKLGVRKQDKSRK